MLHIKRWYLKKTTSNFLPDPNSKSSYGGKRNKNAVNEDWLFNRRLLDNNVWYSTYWKLSSSFLLWFQGFSGIVRAVRCRWYCSPLWFGSGTACLSRHPLTMSRTEMFRKPSGTSKLSPENSASSQTAVPLSPDRIMSSRLDEIVIVLKRPVIF